MKDKKGFTLIELLVSLVILSLSMVFITSFVLNFRDERGNLALDVSSMITKNAISRELNHDASIYHIESIEVLNDKKCVINYELSEPRTLQISDDNKTLKYLDSSNKEIFVRTISTDKEFTSISLVADAYERGEEYINLSIGLSDGNSIEVYSYNDFWSVVGFKDLVVTFDSNGGDFQSGDINQRVCTIYSKGASCSINDTPIVTKPDSVFTDWYTSETEGTIVDFNNISSPQTVYAHYSKCAVGMYAYNNVCTTCTNSKGVSSWDDSGTCKISACQNNYVFNEALNMCIANVTIANLISNPSFENEFTDWSSYPSDHTISTAEAKFGTHSLRNYHASQYTGAYQEVTPIAGHTYYISAWMKTKAVGSGKRCSLAVGVNHDGLSEYDWPVYMSQVNTNVWEKLGSTYTFPSGTTGGVFSVKAGQYNGTDKTEECYTDGLMLIDLTAAFGAGNEPSIDWCNDNIDYFEGSKTILAPINNSYNHTGSYQTFTANNTGYYKIEAYGAQGGTGTYATGGKGAKVSGYVYLNSGEKLYVYVGGQSIFTKLGYNGAGSNGTNTSWETYGGGGATDIRYFGSTSPSSSDLEWNSSLGLNSRILVAAGGGGSYNYDNTYKANGGAGGTLVGANGTATKNSVATGGTQISGGSGNNGNTSYSGSFGQGGTGGTSLRTGGGGGYYGGGGTYNIGSSAESAAGGSSFMSGYAGSNAITSSSSRTHTNNTLHYSGKYFVKGSMQAGVKEGNGSVTITYVGELPRTNTKLDNVRYIKDCVNGSNVNIWAHWNEIQAVKNGINVAYGKNVTGTTAENTSAPYINIVDGDIFEYGAATSSGTLCVTVDLATSYDLDEIAVWHYFEDGRTYNNNVTYVSSDNTNWTVLMNRTEAETPNGKRVNAFQ